MLVFNLGRKTLPSTATTASAARRRDSICRQFCKCLFFPQQLVLIPSPPPPPPQTQTHEYAGHLIVVIIDEEDEEATKPSTAAKSSAATKSSAAIKSSVGVDERKLAAKPSTTGVIVELTDKEKRAKNKKIKEEVLQKNPQFKAVLSVPNAFGPEH
jgi:hypothetical protein